MLSSVIQTNGAICGNLLPNKEEGKKARRRDTGEGASMEVEAKKRRLTEDQVKFMEMRFSEERKLESGRKVHLVKELGIDPKQVAIWFQNRRARSKNKQHEEDYASSNPSMTPLSSKSAIMKLRSEMLVLNHKINGAAVRSAGGDKKAERSDHGGGGVMSSSSPSTSFSMDTSKAFHGGIGREEDELLYINDYAHILDWLQSCEM